MIEHFDMVAAPGLSAPATPLWRKLLVVWVALFGMLQVASAQTSGTHGDLTYWDDGAEITITGTVSYPTGYLAIPETINGKPVTAIGEEAFLSCASLYGVFIPKSVASIGDRAFKNCAQLRAVQFLGEPPVMGTEVFESAESFFTIYYLVGAFTSPTWHGYSTVRGVSPHPPPSLTSGNFRYLDHGTEVTITGTVSNPIGDLIIPEMIDGKPVTTIGNYAFVVCYDITYLSIPDSVTFIASFAFSGCHNLTSLLIPDSVIAIGDHAFSGCNSLKSVSIGSGVTSIGGWAFLHCDAMAAVSIGDSVTSIGNYAFYGATCLRAISIPDSVTSIGDNAFRECPQLEVVQFMGDAPSMGSHVFLAASPDLILYYLGSGFTSPTWYGYPAVSGVSPTPIPVPTPQVNSGIFRYLDNGTEIKITGYFSNPVGELVIPETIGGKPVTAIGEQAFAGCYDITSLVLPGNLRSIGDSAFEWCWNLTTLSIGDGGGVSIGNHAFYQNESLTAVTIGDGGASIGDYAFAWCRSLTTVSIGDGGTSVESYAFEGCRNLTTVSIGEGGASIADYAFYQRETLTTVTIGDGGASIGDYAFEGCRNLATLSIGAGETSIGLRAFFACGSLVSLAMPEGVTFIGDSAFASCSSLASLTIPDSVTTIGNYAFAGCSSLTSLVIPDSVTMIGEGAFFSCNSLTSLVIPGSVTTIGDSAFASCGSLVSLEILDSVTIIGDYAFVGCYSLVSLVIPDSVTTIGDYAFSWCVSLTSVSIGTGVTSIGSSAFEGGADLRILHFAGDAPVMGESVFHLVHPDFTIHYLGSGFTSPIWQGYPAVYGGLPTSNMLRIVLGEGGKTGPNLAGKNLRIGRQYTITAVPDKGMLFKEWRQGGEVVSTNARLTFTMEDWLQLTPVFVEDFFPGVAGTYNGFFLPEEEAESGEELLDKTAFASLVLTSKGAFSGTLLHKGLRFAVRGQFDANGEAEVVIKRSELVLKMALDFDQKQLHGQLGEDLFLQAGCFAYSGRGSGLHPLAKTRYTGILPGSIANSSTGHGFVLLEVDAKGRAKLTGKLADGTPLVASAFLEAGEDSWKLPVFLPLYPDAIGLLVGGVEISGDELKSLEGVLGWYRPPNVPKSFLLPTGYFGELAVFGGRYEKPGRGEYYLTGESYGAFYLDVMSETTYPQKERRYSHWGYENNTHISAPRGSGWSFKYIASTGLLRGTVPEIVNGKIRAVKFEGVVIPRINALNPSPWEVLRGAGFFTTKTESGSIEVIPIK